MLFCIKFMKKISERLDMFSGYACFCFAIELNLLSITFFRNIQCQMSEKSMVSTSCLRNRFVSYLQVTLQICLMSSESLSDMFLHFLFTFDYIGIVSLDIIDLFPHLLHLRFKLLKLTALYLLMPFALNFHLQFFVIPDQQLLISHHLFLELLQFFNSVFQGFISLDVILLNFADAGFLLIFKLLVEGERVILLLNDRIELRPVLGGFCILILRDFLGKVVLVEGLIVILVFFREVREVLVEVGVGCLGKCRISALSFSVLKVFHFVLYFVQGLLSFGNFSQGGFIFAEVRLIHSNQQLQIL